MEQAETPEKKAADILLRGGKMLSLACPICSSPIYQTKEGETLCVVCNRPVKIVSKKDMEQKQSASPPSPKKPSSSQKSKKKSPSKKRPLFDLDGVDELRDALNSQLYVLSERIRNETDVEMLARLVDTADQIMELLVSINHNT